MRGRPRRVAGPLPFALRALCAMAGVAMLVAPGRVSAWGPVRRRPPKPAAIERTPADVPLPPSDSTPATPAPLPPPPPAPGPGPGSAAGAPTPDANAGPAGGPPTPTPPPRPVPEPAPAAAATTPTVERAPPAEPPARLSKDEVTDPGYLPGYKAHPGFGPSPWSPTVGSLPGGITPAFQSPMPPGEWTFKWTGYLSATAQASVNERPNPGPGQDKRVYHVPPSTPDDYQSFVGTATMPGQWIAMNFRYGNKDVSANVTLSTWNPSQPTTFYQMGSQGFVNNAFLAYNLPALGPVKLSAQAGYFYNYHGNLGQYGPGIYQMPIVGGARGLGESVTGEMSLSPTLTLVFEQGIMGDRSGRPPSGIVPANPLYGLNPVLPAAYVFHLHAGLVRRGEYTLRANVHYLLNWAMDDRVQTNCFLTMSNPQASGTFGCQQNVDNMTTRGVDERYIPDGHIAVYGADATVSHNTYGLLGLGASHIDADHAYLLRGLLTFGGEGQHIAERWLGLETQGTGTIDAAAINWSGSLARIINGNRPFDANGPNLLLDAGAVFAVGRPAKFPGLPINTEYDDRRRFKLGVNALYAFLPWLAVGARVDHVVPSTKDSSQTFQVLAAKLVFKTDWQSRETITLLYAKWFYGEHTHPEYSVLQPPWLDDQLIALNVNMWW